MWEEPCAGRAVLGCAARDVVHRKVELLERWLWFVYAADGHRLSIGERCSVLECRASKDLVGYSVEEEENCNWSAIDLLLEQSDGARSLRWTRSGPVEKIRHCQVEEGPRREEDVQVLLFFSLWYARRSSTDESTDG